MIKFHIQVFHKIDSTKESDRRMFEDFINTHNIVHIEKEAWYANMNLADYKIIYGDLEEVNLKWFKY